ncbi:MAG: YciI family protein [Gemmatimonadota bacterium]
MRFLLLIYNDGTLLDALPKDQFDSTMRDCLSHADELRQKGCLLDSQMLESAQSAKSLRVRNGRQTITDGPFAETKEMLAGFNLIEADNMDEALRIARQFPWAETGCIEVREVKDIGAVRRSVAAPSLH